MLKHSPQRKSASSGGLGSVLFTNTQQRVLACLFGQPERSYFANELIHLTGAGSGAVQRELKRLSESGLITSQMRGNQRHFQANPHSPIFQELTQIVQKTFGLALPIREALAPYQEAIRCAFIFGSIAKKQDTVASDVDLFVISDSLSYADLVNQLLGTEVRLGRGINTTIYTEADVRQRLMDGNAFLSRVLEQPKVWIIGNESDIPT
ncbi:MAG: transcriptional regulator [Oxalobacteraceae bacterium]|nr:transcriptional regulator [Oxalobacteraceae bacterium]NDG08563.1 transcriptional regulator [Oxalobacteraceae bacterium]